MKKIILLLLLFPFVVFAQTPTENYIKSTTYKIPTLNPSTVGFEDKKEEITYFDGLGRPIQIIQHRGSAEGKDIVTPIKYDVLGRRPIEYLPVPLQTTSLNFTPNQDIIGNPYYPSKYGVDGDYPFSEKRFEASALGRVLEQGAPGEDWRVDAGHTIQFGYGTNTTFEVQRFTAQATWNATTNLYDIAFGGGQTSSFYPANELFKTVTKDENWVPGSSDHTVEEFKNKQGQVVLKRTYNEGLQHNTYYVYDQFGNLTFVLPPLANSSIATAVLAGLCYQYKYDARNRLVEKKLPGKQWEFLVYDKLNRVVATGPANSPFNDFTGNGWVVTKYDIYNRVAYTGWFQNQQATFDSTTRTQMQNLFDSNAIISETALIGQSNSVDNTVINYTKQVEPVSGFRLLSIHYYDNYVVNAIPLPLPQSIFDQPVITNAKGLPTVTWSRIMGSLNTPVFEKSMLVYNHKGEVIRNYKQNYLGGYTYTDTKFDFAGKTSYTSTHHKRLQGSDEIIIREDFVYTDQDRLETHTHRITFQGVDRPVERISKNEYDDLGQLKNKHVGGPAIAELPLQKVDYGYNIRGWLKSINNIEGLSQSGEPNDLFAFKLNYNTVENSVEDAVEPLYNGNISETFWISNSDNTKRKYGYVYDNLNRLTEAIYQKPDLGNPEYQVTKAYNEEVSYDRNGNILQLLRKGYLDGNQGNNYIIDNLEYLYDSNSNVLRRIDDHSNSLDGFLDGNKNRQFNSAHYDYDYSYDANGNMKVDWNKKIEDIAYNHLNLPVKITFKVDAGQKFIAYIYNALGHKVRKHVLNQSPNGEQMNVMTDYLDGFQYIDGVLQFFPTAEGYVSVSNGNTFNYVYNYTDHLGNIRLSYTKEGSVLRILEENHYYPFGMKHSYNREIRQWEGTPGTGGISAVVEEVRRSKYQYKYNGKEYQDELGLNMTAMDFRQYDSAIGRFVGMDRLAEFTHSITPYRFALNNPNYFNDPSGLSEFENNNEGLAHCPTCPNTPAFQPLIDDPNNEYFYDPETNTASQVIELDEVVVENNSKSSSNTDYHDVSMMFRKYSGYALTVQKPLGEAFASGTRYASQSYPSHTSNVVFQKSILGKKVSVPLGNYNTATIGKISKALKITGRTLGVVAVGSGIYSIANDGLNISNGLDTTMALLALSPTGVGQAIAGTYFLLNTVSQLTTGKDIGQHIQEQIDGE